MMMPRPFQIPMAALLPRENINFLPAGKNIGVTHLTNGAFRLHPIEWMVGEAAGTIAALAIARGAVPPAAVVQEDLARAGVPLVWFDDLPVDHTDFARSSGPPFAAVPAGHRPPRIAGCAHLSRRSGHGSDAPHA
jgi:hypothetical protein